MRIPVTTTTQHKKLALLKYFYTTTTIIIIIIIMVGYITKPAREINKSLVEFLPELDSDYARYPMKHVRWYSHTETGPKGEPCFIPRQGTSPTSRKKDYVYCPDGIAGRGYYSLMCHASYVCLHKKLQTLAPQGATCPCFASKETRKLLDRYDDVKRVDFMRQLCTPKPDDQLASDIVMGRAKATADMVYNATQAEATVINAINVATL